MTHQAAEHPPWWRVTVLLFAVAFGTNVSTPLLVLYRHRLHLSATAVTSIFATYAVGLIVALLFAGPGSDRVGRRPVVLLFALLACLASLVFIPAADHEWLLYLARFVQGLVSGAVFSVGSAWLAELSGHPYAAAKRASFAMNAGFSLGPLTAGLLGQFGPWPTTLPYLVHVGLCVVALAIAVPTGETLLQRRAGPLLRIGLPPEGRSAFWLLLVPTAICVFAFPATAITALPLLFSSDTHGIAVTGLVAGITLGAAALVSPAARPLGAAAAPVGLGFGAIGFGVSVAVAEGAPWEVLVPVAVLLGTASGLCMTAGLAIAQLLSTDATRGAVNAAYYAVVYLGFGTPVLVTAVAGKALSVPLAALAVAVGLLGGWLAVAGRRVVVGAHPPVLGDQW